MKDRENVISDLEEQIAWIRDNDFHKFPGWGHAVLAMRDALALLKAQEPRVMKIGDVRNWVNSDRVTREPIVIEIRSGVCAWIIDDEVRELPGEADLSSDLYGKTWRCWTSRPDQATREATPWSEQDQREYQAAVEMAEYCERYEPTYNAEDGSM